MTVSECHDHTTLLSTVFFVSGHFVAPGIHIHYMSMTCQTTWLLMNLFHHSGMDWNATMPARVVKIKTENIDEYVTYQSEVRVSV